MQMFKMRWPDPAHWPYFACLWHRRSSGSSSSGERPATEYDVGVMSTTLGRWVNVKFEVYTRSCRANFLSFWYV
jgi:hypothetical protein